MTALPFIVSLMEKDCQLSEISAINSLTGLPKRKNSCDISIKDGLFDFNVGFIGTAILAVFFVAMECFGVPTGQEVQAAGATSQQLN